MIPNFLENLRHLIFVALATSTFVVNGSRATLAQVSDVPDPDRNGDFPTALVLGHRGYYGNQKWLVVSHSEDGLDEDLNCRYTPNGEIRSRVAPGSIVEAVFLGELNLDPRNGSVEPNLANDAIVESDGGPWLRVRGTSDLFYPFQVGDWESLGECYVRANEQYITPVNNDELLRPQ